MKRALIVGINHYQLSPLNGCVADATRMNELLSENEDRSKNFETKLLVTPETRITRSSLRGQLEELFSGPGDVALFYFAGHGTINSYGGYIVTQDSARFDEGISMQDVLTMANQSKVTEIVIILDCCFSGTFGAAPALNSGNTAILREGITVLTASTGTQVSRENAEGGIFTNAVVAALKGGASDVMGKVTVASVYAYVDQILGSWGQRPLFKSNVTKLTPVRNCKPALDIVTLKKLPEIFNDAHSSLALDPSFEPEAEPHHPQNEAIFKILQKYRAARLVEPVGEDHLYFAAMNSKSCVLTPLGQFYWKLAKDRKI